MRIGIIGINHKSAPLFLRERFAKICRYCFDGVCFSHLSISHVVLSTCNRVEIFFSAEDLAEAHSYLLSLLRKAIAVAFEHKIYSYFGKDCFFHLACVTAGLDSALLGETEIQGQVKQAYQKSLKQRPLSFALHFLFQKSLKMGKEIRTQYSLTGGSPSLEKAIFSLASEEYADLGNRRVLFVGLSQINYQLYLFFKQKGLHHLCFCNRSEEKALHKEVPFLAWKELKNWHHYEIIIFATKSSRYLIQYVENKPLVQEGKRLLIDLSMPRNVDPDFNHHPKMHLWNIDQIHQMISQKNTQKEAKMLYLKNHIVTSFVEKQITLFKDKENKKAPHLFSYVS